MATSPKKDTSQTNTPMVRLTTFLAVVIPCIIAVVSLGALFTISVIGNFRKDANHSESTGGDGTDVANTGSDSTGSSDSEYAALFDAFRRVSSQDVLDLLSSGGTGFVYIGRPTCPHCRAFSPLLTDISAEVGVDILYYDTDTAQADGELRNQVLDAFDITGVPAFFFVRGGVITEQLSSTTSETTIRSFLVKYRS